MTALWGEYEWDDCKGDVEVRYRDTERVHWALRLIALVLIVVVPWGLVFLLLDLVGLL